VSADELRELGAHIAEQQAPLLEAASLAADGGSDVTRRRLVERVQRRSGGTARGTSGNTAARSRTRTWLALAAGVASTLLALGQWLRGSDEALRFTVGDERGVLSALEAAPADSDLLLRFSDGSVVELAAGARARVASLHADGADIVLESGRARVDVVPRRGAQRAHWQIRSGPFSVQVKGTSFWLSWDAAADALSLELLRGHVRVSGCNLGEGREVRAGERLAASCPRSEAAAAPATPPAVLAPGAAAPGQAAPSVAEPLELRRSAASAARRSQARSSQPRPLSRRQETWQELAQQGDFRGAYALVASRGWDAELAQSPRADLLLLGQAARVTGHVSEAQRAYVAVRRRFAGSAAAARAAFSLGLLAFDATPSEAIEWLETYLAEQPAGALAEAALDRLLEASLRLREPAPRRQIAERYLEQYAAGPHAAEARRIIAGSRATE